MLASGEVIDSQHLVRRRTYGQSVDGVAGSVIGKTFDAFCIAGMAVTSEFTFGAHAANTVGPLLQLITFSKVDENLTTYLNITGGYATVLDRGPKGLLIDLLIAIRINLQLL
jgi:hypothetical protein